ncbi:hypothetical protein KCP75_02135 [Salmonella enterica subsp. enterica]|nr:hypothetical protein KCP75_02135 [Salmonella enterica subsp. enterica]
MFRFTGVLGKHRVMLNQPDFIMALFSSRISGKVMHGLRDSFMGLKAELADRIFILIQNISVE